VNRKYAIDTPGRIKSAWAYVDSAVSTIAHIVRFTPLASLTFPVPAPNSCLPSLDKRTPGESRDREATGPRLLRIAGLETPRRT
jgi:hypothetical protein